MIIGWIAGVIIGLLVACVLFRVFFTGWDDFRECVEYHLIPDCVSWFRGEGMEDAWAELRLSIWISASAGSGFLAYLALANLT